MGLISRVLSRTYRFEPPTMSGLLRMSLARLGGHGHSGPAKRIYNIRVGTVPALQTPEAAHALRTIYAESFVGRLCFFGIPMLVLTSIPPMMTDINHWKAYKDSL